MFELLKEFVWSLDASLQQSHSSLGKQSFHPSISHLSSFTGPAEHPNQEELFPFVENWCKERPNQPRISFGTDKFHLLSCLNEKPSSAFVATTPPLTPLTPPLTLDTQSSTKQRSWGIRHRHRWGPWTLQRPLASDSTQGDLILLFHVSSLGKCLKKSLEPETKVLHSYE